MSKKECRLFPMNDYSNYSRPLEQVYLEELTGTMYMAVHELNEHGQAISKIIAIVPLFDPEDRSKALSYERYLEL